MILKKIKWTLKRHPFLYLTRFRLLSKNTSVDAIESCSYNTLNKKTDIPGLYHDINAEIFKNVKPESDLDLIKHLVTWLLDHTNFGPGLSVTSEKALDILLYGKGGVCSDMVQVFNNFCVINDIPVREWGTTSAPFNRANGGHSFNEVYIKNFKKWLLIDPSWGGMFYDENNRALSAVELYSLNRTHQPVHYQSFIPNKEIPIEHVNKNYLNPDITPFLICDYRNKTYDRSLRFARPYIPIFIIHFFIYLSGRGYHYKFPLDDYKKIFS